MTRQAETGAVPSVSGLELARSSGYGRTVVIHQVANSAGPALQSEDLTKLHDTILLSLANNHPVIVTMGTDAIEEVAFFLSLVLEPCLPVILTGAMRSHDDSRADGPRNIAYCVKLLEGGTQPPGVYVCFGGRLIPGHCVIKSHTTNLMAFGADRSETSPDFRIPFRGFALPTIVVKPGLMDDLAFLKEIEMKALVVEATGEGNVPASAEAPIVEVAGRMPVLLTSRVAAGPLGMSYGYVGGSRRLVEAGVVATRWSSPKLRMLASLAVGAFGPSAAEYLRKVLEGSPSTQVAQR